jgi:hypothetical protein
MLAGRAMAGHRPVVATAILVLGACTPAPRPSEPARHPAAPPDFPAAPYETGFDSGGQVYRIEPPGSEVRIYVYRGGKLAHLGHNHVISTRTVRGFVWLADEFAQSRFDLFVALDSLKVDQPDLRRAAGPGFDTEPSAADIAATRTNMLGERGLDAARFPFVVLAGTPAGGQPPNFSLDVDVEIRGTRRTRSIPVTLRISADRLIISGSFSLRQSAFGVEPFSALGGMLTVQDRVELRFDLLAYAD